MALRIAVLLIAWVAFGNVAARAGEFDEARWSKLAQPAFRLIANSGALLFPTDQGLPFTEVPTSFAQDGDGFLWVGTQNGLERWDGYRFRTFMPGREPGDLRDSFIQVLHTDAQGRLWVGMNAGGLAMYDRDHDRFITFPIGASGVSGKWVTAIDDDGAGGLWIATSGGVDHLSADARQFSHVKHHEGDDGSLRDDYARALLHDRSGGLSVGTAKGLVHRAPGTEIFAPIQLPTASGAVSQVRTLFQASDGRIWIGTRRDGAYVIAPDAVLARPLSDQGQAGGGIQAQEILSAAEAVSGEIWLGTYGQGIFAVDPVSLRTHVITHDPFVPTSLIDDTVWALYRSSSGLMWVGTSHGVSHHNPQQSILSIFGLSTDRPDLIGDIVSMSTLGDDHIALGAVHSGIELIAPDSAHIDEIRPDPDKPEASLPKDSVTAISTAEDGNMLVGTRQGLYRWDQSHHRAEQLTIAGRDPAEQVWTMLYRQQHLWVGGPDGAWELSFHAGSLEGQRRIGSDLDLKRATVFAPAPGGAMWIGTMDSGLLHFDPASGTVQPVRFRPQETDVAVTCLVTSLLTDRSGRLWVGTNGEGIFIIEVAKSGAIKVIRQLGVDDGLTNSSIDQLLEDPHGNIWVSTNNGIAEIDPHDLAVRPIRSGDGLAISSYWVGSGVATQQGELVFGGEGGLTIIRPDQLAARSKYHSPLVITSIEVGDHAVPSSRYNSASQQDPLHIPADANRFAVEFSALDYASAMTIDMPTSWTATIMNGSTPMRTIA